MNLNKKNLGTLNEYEIRGNYHSENRMSKSWIPIYHRRNHVVKNTLVEHCSKNSLILDLGCGEGEIVNELRKEGFENVFGIDSYAKFTIENNMITANCLEIPFKDESVDILICLDLIEHIPLNYQSVISDEISRVLKNDGIAIMSFPNMAHLRSRLRMLFKGQPWRNRLEKHPGELTLNERIGVMSNSGLRMTDSLGLYLTITKTPTIRGRVGKLLSYLTFHPNNLPSLCQSVICIFQKGKTDIKKSILKKAYKSFRMK